MATITPPASMLPTRSRQGIIAALLDQLGGVSADRVLLQPAPGTANEADLLQANEQLGTLRVDRRHAGGEGDGNDVLDGGSVLPGLQIQLADLFGVMDL